MEVHLHSLLVSCSYQGDVTPDLQFLRSVFLCASHCLSVSLLTYLKNQWTSCTNSAIFSVHVNVPWLDPSSCNTLCTSGFVDDVMFAHNGVQNDKDSYH